LLIDVEEDVALGHQTQLRWNDREQRTEAGRLLAALKDTEAGRLLAALKDPARGWTRSLWGRAPDAGSATSFSLTAPRFAAYGVDLWVPELGGKFDPRNPSHKMLMSVLGGMSESERQHVQARVREPCYGYAARCVPHPVPAKRAKGAKKTYLDPDPLQAPVVRRIFGWRVIEWLGYQAVADRLNQDLAGNPPPVPLDPARAVGRWTALGP
jgi:hypothetical protein